MNPQFERLFHSIRRGIEQNVRYAVKTLEVSRKKDVEAIKSRIEKIKNSEIVMLKEKLDEIKESLTRVEALKPYLSALEAATQMTKKTKKRKSANPRTKSAGRKTRKPQKPAQTI